MTDYWTENGIEKPQQIVVCAACRYGLLILCSARHWDRVMRDQYTLAKATGAYPHASKFEEGFIDQFGDFLTREEAREIVNKNGQPFDAERNGGICGRNDTVLYSEGLY